MLFFKKKESVNFLSDSLIYAACALIYIISVAMLMHNGSSIFGKSPGVFGAAAFLLLFVFSAIVMGLLVLGKPTSLYLMGLKKEAVHLLLYIILWLFAFLVCMLFVSTLTAF